MWGVSLKGDTNDDWGLLQIEKKEKDDVISMISLKRKKVEACRLQHTKSNPSKLVFTRPVFTYNRNYNALPHNYSNPPNVEVPAFMFQTKID
jgi:hypothetical protein